MTRHTLNRLLGTLLLLGVVLPAAAQQDFMDIVLRSGQKISYPVSEIAEVCFHAEAEPGDGTREHPYTVPEALVAYQTQGAARQVWVKGVVVGTVAGSYLSDARFSLDGCSASNLLIAASAWETGASRCLPVQLPAGDIRKALNLQDNPDNFHRELLLYGSLDKYFGGAGLKGPQKYEIGAKADTEIEPAGDHPGRIEVPALISGDELIVHQAFVSDGSTDRVPNYYVSYSPTAHHAHWVAYRFDNVTRRQNTSRAEGSSYPQDPDCRSSLPANAFAATGYDHGHICASADRLYSSQANEQTFYMTNMSPQIPNFNRGYWRGYESFVQSLAADAAFADTLYVVKGGTIASGQTAGQIDCSGLSVPVPKHYFVALLKLKAGRYSAIAFWMEHREYDTVGDKPADFRAHALSIDELERLTGFDFYTALPAATQQEVEAAYDFGQWGLAPDRVATRYFQWEWE